MSGPSSRTRIERFIADLRLLLAVSSLFAVWFDPNTTESANAGLINVANAIFVGYCIILVVLTRVRTFSGSAIVAMHAVDIGAFSFFQAFTLGPSSPFFLYFVFSMFCGALRWGWRGTLTTSAVVGLAYLSITVALARLFPDQFDLTRFVTRVVYLLSASGMLAYLGRHEERLRNELERLARWPSPAGIPERRAIELMLAHAARIVGADRAMVVWDAGDEPLIHIGIWTLEGLVLTEHAPDAVPAPADIQMDAHRGALAPEVAAMLSIPNLAAARFRTDQVSGQVFFAGLGAPAAEAALLTEVVAREVGATLAQIHSGHQAQELAAREERLRLARDLHDGVLQSLTAIRFELSAIGQAVHSGDPSAPGRLMGLERALSIEQRELRLFIDGLRPGAPPPPPTISLSERLAALRERLALEWKTPVAIRVINGARPTAARLADAVPLMVHEAVTNALKHAQPSTVTVTVDGDATTLRIVVADDGRGFGFKGRYDHAALETAAVAPRSLFERVSALGGRMSIESSDTGSRVEMVLSA